MNMDEILANLWVTPKCDGDIWLRNGETQKLLAVDVHSTLVRNRSRATSRIQKESDTRVILLTKQNSTRAESERSSIWQSDVLLMHQAISNGL